MARVKAASVKTKQTTKRELYATICFYYPQYRLEQAQGLSARNAQLLLKTAQKLEAMRMYSLTQIAAAPHTRNGSGVKKLLDHFKRLSQE